MQSKWTAGSSPAVTKDAAERAADDGQRAYLRKGSAPKDNP